jgi:hypothetical protein
LAHFAELDENNVVIRVIVVDNKDICDANGVEKENIGIAFCQKLFAGNWKQTSYNSKIRKNYAGAGYVYREDIDAFVPPNEFKSWTLDEETAKWKPPVPEPKEGLHTWNESTLSWEKYIE